MRHQAILLMIFILCIVPSTYAQDTYNYRPLATEGKVWYFKYDDSYRKNLYYSYVIKGDTVINEKVYKKLYMQHSRFFLYTAALRDEGTRAYMVPADSTREFIYYDMELQETIDLAYGLGAKPNGRDWSGPLRKQFFLSTYLPYHTWFTWVESVGEVDDDYFRCSFWRDPSSGIDFSGNRLVSCIEDGNYIWGTGTPNPSRYEVPLTYENKAGDNRQPSEIWVEWEDGFLTFYGKEVEDEFKIYIDGYDAFSYMSLKGNFCCTYAIERTQTHDFLRMYRIESASEAFSFAASYATLPNGPEEIPSRPFIEEGKVWKVGRFPEAGDTNTAQELEYYYFDGDTIIRDLRCKTMKCRHDVFDQQNHRESWTEAIGVIYEDRGRIYLNEPGSEKFDIIYDFKSPQESRFRIENSSSIPERNLDEAIVVKRAAEMSERFKGISSTISLWICINARYDHTAEVNWMEGVGNVYRPLDNYPQTDGYPYLLMSCTVGDEVLYYNPDLMDGVTPPDGADVKKHWIDFTHIKKPRPKAPARERTANETDEENLTGEYSDHELFVNLKILSGTYAVTLKDAADNEVYRRDVQTSSTIALTTDLTKYPAGTYMLVVENSEEQYTATLTLPLDDTAVRDLPSIVNCKLSNCKWYDLSGRQLSTPPAKGIYIRDGKKVVVK